MARSGRAVPPDDRRSCSTVRAAVLDEWSPALGGDLGHEVDAARVPGRALDEPAQRQPAAARRAVPRDRLGGVGAAGRVEAAPRRQRGADGPRVEADGAQQDRRDHRRRRSASPSNRSSPAARSRCSTADVGVRRLGPGPHHQVGRRREPVQLGRDDGAQPPGHPMADHGVADGLADDETGPRTGRRDARDAQPALGPLGEEVEHHGRPPGAPAGPDDRGELRTPAQACLRGQHVRRRASRDPCADDRRGSPGPRGSASAAGSRGSSTDGGCSAGTCACSRGTPTT